MAVAIPYNFIIVTLLYVCLILPSTLATKVSYCSKKANYGVQVTGVEISPNPVKAGEEAVFKVSATTGEDLAGGQVVIDVSFFGLHVHSETIDLCEETPCPVYAGDFVLSHRQTLPSFTPPGSYTLQMKMQDVNNHLLTCIKFGFHIALGSSVSSI